MKKITLLTLLMWSSLFYGQEYLNEDFEGTFLPTGWADVAATGDVAGYPWRASTTSSNSGTKSAFYNELFNLTDGENAGSPDAKNKWLVTPAMNFTSATNPELTYYETVRFPDFPATTGVYYSTDYAGDANTATWVAVNTTFGFTSGEDLVWKIRGAFDLSGANGNTSVVIGFNYQGTSDSEWFIDDVLVREAPTCVEPSFGSISNVMATSADFTWTSGPGGTETLWDVNLLDITGGDTNPDADGTITNTPGVPSANQFAFTSLTPGNSYAAYVRADCGGGDKSAWTGPFTFDTSSSNDDCSGAEVFTQEVEIATSASATAHNGTISGATNSGLAAEMCNGSAGTANDDVWFEFEARTDAVNITFESMDFDGVAMLYSGTCGSLTLIDCADDTFSGSNDTEEIDASGLTAGTTYYVRVFSWDATPVADGSFTVKFWSSEALSNDDVEDNTVEFRLYPNPVQDKLNLRAQDNIENVSIYNMLGQEVLRQAPNKNSSEVDMSALQAGSYFVKVTIDGVTETKQVIKR